MSNKNDFIKSVVALYNKTPHKSVSQATNWFRSKLFMSNKGHLMSLSERRRNSLKMGKMYFFKYDALHKDTLPYWDKFPLIIPLKQFGGGFIGLNLHYIPPNERVMVLSNIYQLIMRYSNNEMALMSAVYTSIKNSMRKYRVLKHCLKRYKRTQVRSPFIEIEPDEFIYVCLMPYEEFQKSSKASVWKDRR